ncbi:phospholipase C, phosphocholine-specific [Iodobacter sp. LRB]|uniref:phosphocholine-specific phospholipase C n=1 Tax=unclassified Iodobacter TaxID=235634 RepID=UPI000C107A55|nr:phospholipase C, phosphocholine-specific [Iodobacter sp. BJB302]PHV02856.1 phospholipase C, phosphocholine-specific [Iodobacter sp. BJB302]
MFSKDRRSFLSFAATTAGTTVAGGWLPGLIQQALAIPANNATGTIADVEHVVIFMQENRSFDHYFGSLSGVRGFDDPRAITLPGGKPVWYQTDANGGHVLPFHFDAKNTSALSVGTNHSWKGSQATWQGWDAWVKQKTPQTMGYFDRGDLPFYYALADAFTICDAYHCSIFGATDPNRMYSLTGTSQGWLSSMGSLYNINAAGYYHADPKYDNLTPGVTQSAPNWRTYAETLEANNVSWKVYQEWDNYGDNYLAYFKNFRVNADGSALGSQSPLYQKGRALAAGSAENNAPGTKGDWLVNAFADDVRNNRLPQVSWICAPNDYTEHSPNSPNAGENLTARLLAALVANPDVWSKTVFMLMYDENDGFFDHVPSDLAPLNDNMGKTTLNDIGQYENYHGEPVGLGPRVPMLIISPWSKGGRVCSQLFDHTSKIRFLEEWLVRGLGKKRSDVQCDLISPWRRAVCGDLTSAFDFKRPNSAWPASVPKTTAYRLVTGKPYPQPPVNQTLPIQEPCPTATGTRYACALPYELSVEAYVNHSRQVELTFGNTGHAGAAYIVYSGIRSDGPWYYTVEAGKRIEKEIWNWQADLYALSVRGANGFLRDFKGSLSALSGNAQPEIQTTYDALNGNLWLTLSNANGIKACQLTISDNAYGIASVSYSLAPGQTRKVECKLKASFGWYDFSIRSDSDAQYLRRVAGHVETGSASRTDPIIGTNRNKTEITPLTTAALNISRGSAIEFNYTAPNGQLDPQNWIGIYAKGTSPGNGNALQWQYASLVRGAVTFSSQDLPAGDYTVWYLYKNSHAVLGGPVSFSVHALSSTNASVKQGTAISFDYAVAPSKLSSKNWIGIWKSGITPGTVGSILWQYTDKANDSARFDTSKLAPGQYAAWCLYNDGYTPLSGPCLFTVI